MVNHDKTTHGFVLPNPKKLGAIRGIYSGVAHFSLGHCPGVPVTRPLPSWLSQSGCLDEAVLFGALP
eukprot:scaffold22385_cov19-Tisochrysis_lutea.AAC.1